jgi:hypothetical protein
MQHCSSWQHADTRQAAPQPLHLLLLLLLLWLGLGSPSAAGSSNRGTVLSTLQGGYMGKVLMHSLRWEHLQL